MPQDLAALLHRTLPGAVPGAARRMSGGEIPDKPGTGGGTVRPLLPARNWHSSVVIEPNIKVLPVFFCQRLDSFRRGLFVGFLRDFDRIVRDAENVNGSGRDISIIHCESVLCRKRNADQNEQCAEHRESFLEIRAFHVPIPQVEVQINFAAVFDIPIA
jgi:hypothetical protein